jgi:hypothetical protein
MINIRPNSKGIFPLAPRGEVFTLSLGNMTAFTVCLTQGPYGLFVGIEGHGAYPFATYPHPGYVKQKLGIRYEGDANNFADFLADQLGVGDGKRFGEYAYPRLTEEAA